MLYVICGHGKSSKGYDPGSGGGGHNEADLVRKLAARMKALDPTQVTVLDTNQDWLYGDWDYIKRTVGNNPMVELHMDAAASTAKGGHVIVCEGLEPDKQDKQLAQNISIMFPGRAQSIVKRNNLGNPKKAKARNINYRLLECCFITNDNDRNKFINRMDDVAKTILAAFGIQVITKGWLSMLTDAQQTELYNMTKAIYNEVTRTDDPSGRGKKMTTHTHTKWIATELANTKNAVDHIEDMVEGIVKKEGDTDGQA